MPYNNYTKRLDKNVTLERQFKMSLIKKNFKISCSLANLKSSLLMYLAYYSNPVYYLISRFNSLIRLSEGLTSLLLVVPQKNASTEDKFNEPRSFNSTTLRPCEKLYEANFNILFKFDFTRAMKLQTKILLHSESSKICCLLNLNHLFFAAIVRSIT